MTFHTSIQHTLFALPAFLAAPAAAAQPSVQADTIQADSLSTPQTAPHHQLHDVVVRTRRPGSTRMAGALNGMNIGLEELFKAACCNLGESFTTNPSVDVSYNDAATGAKQIKLLGLSGTYVQMLTENIPNFRGASTPYSLGYVPGPWMKGIQVSKGAASVKNGYESITGQINVDYLQPEDDPSIEANFFGDTKTRIEANADANVHLGKGLATEVLLHYENEIENHDENHDGFYDRPGVEQYHLQNRWVYRQGNYIFHGGFGLLKENRAGGQMDHSGMDTERFRISLKTHRYEAYAKNAFVLDHAHGTNIALITAGSMHQLDAVYGHKDYYTNEKNGYASLLFETNFTERHNLSAGLSLNHDYFGQLYRGATVGLDASGTSLRRRLNEQETTPGAYAQYTYTLGTRLTAMAGLRIDHSSIYGTFVTPRFHLKYAPFEWGSIRLAAGKGYRTPFALAEYNWMMASGRQLTVADRLQQEAAWNYGASAAFYIPLFGKTLKLNAEYYYTHFDRQVVADYESDASRILIGNLDGRSYSHTLQVDATYTPVRGLDITAAWRLNDVKTTYGGILRERPLTSRYKSLLTASYKTPLGLWQFDATLQLNGGGRNPKPYTLPDGTRSWDSSFPAYEQLSAQITRWFRHWSVYIGGENLTGFKQKRSIYGASDPWGKDFEPTLVWGPVHGPMGYVGIRINFGKL